MTLTTQFLTILSMVGTGIFLGTSHETLRRFERLWLSIGLFRYTVEIFFWLTQAILAYLVLFLVNEGVIRVYVLLALLLGYAMYQSLFAWLYKRILDRVIDIGARIIRFILNMLHLIVIKPIVGIALLVWFCVRKIVQLILLIIKMLLWPIVMIGKLLYRLLPKQVKRYLQSFYRFIRGKWKKDET